MSIRFRFNARKAIEALLYVAEQCPNMYTALKVLYFADKEHLTRYGRFICGDTYVAMRHGPVPSGVYDLIKCARGDGFYDPDVDIAGAFRVEGNSIIPCRRPNLDLLSESDKECLDAAIERYGHLSFAELKKLSHSERAFKDSDENDFIPVEAIARSLPEGKLLLDYLQAN